jgi:ankyrin repeat protein
MKTQIHRRIENSCLYGIRKNLLKLVAVAGAASLLLGCTPASRQTLTPASTGTPRLPVAATASIEDAESLGQQLLEAVRGGDVADAEALIGAGANVDAIDDHGQTCLMQAAVRGNTEIARMLVEAGADLEMKDDQGSTALILAATNGHTEILQLLIEVGADITARNCYYLTGAVNRNHEETSLIAASIYGNAESVRLLIDAGADLDWVDEGGRSAAAHAAFSGRAENLGVLIEAGADLNLVDFRGYTALDWANRQGHIDAAEMLQAAGALTAEEIEASGQQVIQPTIRPVDCTQ